MQNFDQTNHLSDHQNTKVKTPAALFVKSSGKSPINRLSIQQSLSPIHQPSFTNNTVCQNHANKNASYYTEADEERLYFCEKCAINIASKGHNIHKIQTKTSMPSMTPKIGETIRRGNRNPPNVRQGEINNFLNGLKSLRGTIDQTRQTIKQKLIQSQQFYGLQIQQVNDYFSLIMKSLQLQKHKCYNHILTQRKNAQQQIRSMNEQIITIDQDITKIYMDIQDNLDTVYSIEEDMYKLVLSQYFDQKRQFQRCLNGLLLQSIQLRKIQFQGVPESIYNISDTVIQNSINNMDNMQYRLVDSLNADQFHKIRAVSPQKQNYEEFSYGKPYKENSLKFSFQAEKLKLFESQTSLSNKGNFMPNN